MTEHKLCPFCGGTPRYCQNENGKFTLGWIQCTRCFARVLPRVVRVNLSGTVILDEKDIWFMWDERK